MAKRYFNNVISPFPNEIDRDSFGHYLSGITAGEGCFRLTYHLAPTYKGRSVRVPARPQHFEIRQCKVRDDVIAVMPTDDHPPSTWEDEWCGENPDFPAYLASIKAGSSGDA